MKIETTAVHAGREPDPATGALREPIQLSTTFERALEPGASLLWVETPSNPLLRVSDLAALAELAHARGALFGCDNTFASPVLQQPFAHGADLVMHSSTKYLGGHGDVLGGIVVVHEAGPVLARLREFQSAGGGVPSPRAPPQWPGSSNRTRASMEGPLSQTPQNLFRMSVGLEHPADLIADLDQALAG